MFHVNSPNRFEVKSVGICLKSCVNVVIDYGYPFFKTLAIVFVFFDIDIYLLVHSVFQIGFKLIYIDLAVKKFQINVKAIWSNLLSCDRYRNAKST